MFGPEDVVLILVLGLIFFGPNKLPELARALGKATGEFRKAQQEAVDIEKNQQKIKENKDRENKIRNFAIEIGIDVENKTDLEIVEEIRSRLHHENRGI